MIRGIMIAITIHGTVDSTCLLDTVGDTIPSIVPDIMDTVDGVILTMEVTGVDIIVDSMMDTTADTTADMATVADTTIRGIITTVMPMVAMTSDMEVHNHMATGIPGTHTVNLLPTGLQRKPLRLETITGRGAILLQQTAVILRVHELHLQTQI